MDKYTHEEHTFIEKPGFGRERFAVWKMHMLARMLKVCLCSFIAQTTAFNRGMNATRSNLLSQGLQSYRAGGLGDLPPGALQLKSDLLRERDAALKWLDNMIEPQRNGRFSGNRLWDLYQRQLPHADREGWQLRVNSISKSDFCSMLEEKCGKPKKHAKVDRVSARQVFEHWSLVDAEQRANEGYRSPRSPAKSCA